MKKITVLLVLLAVFLGGCTQAEAGWAVTVDGWELPGGSIVIDDTTYVRADELSQALGQELDTALAVDVRGAHWLPLEEICGMLDISILPDPEFGRYYCTSGILNWQIPEGYVVPVLMYHGISDEPWGDTNMFLGVADMEAHLRWLTENGYDCITFEDLPNIAQYDKPVILTFDDGYVCNYTTLYPLLQKYGAKATISIVASSIGNRETSMTREQVKELADSGIVSIQSHTVDHNTLTACDRETKEYEILQSKLEVARLTGREPFALCFPGGAYDQEVLEIMAGHYTVGIATKDQLFVTGSDLFQVTRFSVNRGMTAGELAALMESIEY